MVYAHPSGPVGGASVEIFNFRMHMGSKIMIIPLGLQAWQQILFKKTFAAEYLGYLSQKLKNRYINQQFIQPHFRRNHCKL